MSKSPPRIDDFLPAPRRVPTLNAIAVLVFLAFLVSPLVIELVSIWVVQWFKVMDVALVVRTPVLDFSEATISMCWDEITNWLADQYAAANWSPHSILPFAGILLVLAARMLKK